MIKTWPKESIIYLFCWCGGIYVSLYRIIKYCKHLNSRQIEIRHSNGSVYTDTRFIALKWSHFCPVIKWLNYCWWLSCFSHSKMILSGFSKCHHFFSGPVHFVQYWNGLQGKIENLNTWLVLFSDPHCTRNIWIPDKFVYSFQT